jgi:hypothetical protein
MEQKNMSISKESELTGSKKSAMHFFIQFFQNPF